MCTSELKNLGRIYLVLRQKLTLRVSSLPPEALSSSRGGRTGSLLLKIEREFACGKGMFALIQQAIYQVFHDQDNLYKQEKNQGQTRRI